MSGLQFRKCLSKRYPSSASSKLLHSSCFRFWFLWHLLTLTLTLSLSPSLNLYLVLSICNSHYYYYDHYYSEFCVLGFLFVFHCPSHRVEYKTVCNTFCCFSNFFFFFFFNYLSGFHYSRNKRIYSLESCLSLSINCSLFFLLSASSETIIPWNQLQSAMWDNQQLMDTFLM